MKRFKKQYHNYTEILLFREGFFLLLLSLLSLSSSSQNKNFPFIPNEIVSYEINYNWGFIWVSAGEVSFSVKSSEVYGKPALTITGEGKTFPKYDWFYKVRDIYESKVNAQTLRPYSFIRDVNEGKSQINNAYVFNHYKNEAYSIIRQQDGSFKKDTIEFPLETYDVISMIYKSRCIDFSQYKKDDKIPIKILLDNAVYDTYIRYFGIETIDFRGIAPIKCHKFKPYLIEGTIFTGGEDMTVWVTADENKIPIYIESKILVGNIKAVLTGTTGLKYPKEYMLPQN